jgi:hypothetical protein
MATAAGSEFRVDVHSIEPIPEADRRPNAERWRTI